MIINKNDFTSTKIEIDDVLYNIYVISNVINYESEYTKWIIEEYTSVLKNENEDIIKNENEDIIKDEIEEYTSVLEYYFVIDTVSHEAFSHWVYECAIYLPLYLKLKELYPNIKIHLKAHKKFKKIFFDFFNIQNNEICYDFNAKNNKTIFYDPISSLNDNEITFVYKKQFQHFFKIIKEKTEKSYNSKIEKTIQILLMPRQKLENYKNNDRTYNTDLLEDVVKTKPNTFVLHTDNINTLKEQIEIVQGSQNIILTDGSPFIVNGLFAYNSNIFIIGNSTPWQIQTFCKMGYIFSCIKEKNKVSYVNNFVGNFVGSLDNINKLLVYINRTIY